MKWIVVILVLLNLSAWLLGKRIDPGFKQSPRADQVETINAAGMTVIDLAEEKAMRKKNEALALEEEKIMQLKLDERGKVLMAPSASKEVNATLVPKPAVETPKSVTIVALDRSNTEAKTAPAKKPVEPRKTAASEPAPVPAPEPAPKKPAQAALNCYRIGPFGDQNSLANVRRALNRNSIRYSLDERGGVKRIKAVRVYLDNFSDAAAMQRESKRLKQIEIDHYVVKLSDRSVIQLGYFSEPARATAYQKTLNLGA